MRVILTARRSSPFHPTSRSGAKKRLIATHANSKFSLTPSNQTKRQFLIATRNAFPEAPILAHRGPRIAGSQPTDRDPRIAADLIANGILERLLTHSKQSIRTRSNREKTGAPLQPAIHASRFTIHKSRVTALTTPSPELPPLPPLPLCYSHRVPPNGLRAIAPVRPRVSGSLPLFPAEEVILCAF